MYNTDMPKRADLPSKRKLMRSTIIAAIAAATLLITVVLPAEYGIDPTRIGGVLGLTEMGDIKQQLALEADAADEAATAEALEIQPQTNASPSPSAEITPPAPVQNLWTDETSLMLEPGAAAEVKLVMAQGDTAQYEWAVDKGHLNSDLHTDGADGKTHSYKQGRAETINTGEFTAVSDGAHGWFWRNRSQENVTVTLKVKGDYSELKRLF